ncbi:MAG: hypothetical protein K2L87_04175 [Clostridiales bacterium]|nr:hypothetical protein [Clostridiales bacterium]
MNIYDEISEFYENYQGEKCVYGQSAEGRNLYAMRVGDGKKGVGISQYAIHAREWLTALLALEHIRRGVGFSVWFLPLTNPDGAMLATEGLGSVKSEWRREMLLRINGSEDFSLWKASADAVDLNVNFDARWGTGRCNVLRPASENYIGIRPFCVPESKALRDFTFFVRPKFTLSWHTKGEEIYWRFHQPLLRGGRDLRLAKRLALVSGYALKETPYSAGGYKDWCVEKLKIPAFTIEAGSDEYPHPLGREKLEDLAASVGDTVKHFTEGF